jgi:hypothetical protein
MAGELDHKIRTCHIYLLPYIQLNSPNKTYAIPHVEFFISIIRPVLLIDFTKRHGNAHKTCTPTSQSKKPPKENTSDLNSIRPV